MTGSDTALAKQIEINDASPPFQEHIKFATQNEAAIRQKKVMFENQVASRRENYFGYTTEGLITSVKRSVTSLEV